MRTLCLTVLCCASAPFVFGQLESDTLTFQSSRTVYLQPDQLLFNVSVSSSLDATLDQVVASLQGSGITAADLSGVFASPGNPFVTAVPITGSGLLWSFTLGVPLAKLKGTVASLTTLQTSLQKNSGAVLTFQPEGSRVSSELMQAQSCSLKDLVADAQVQAQRLAAAAGFLAGPILAISDGNSVGVPSLGQFTLVSNVGILGGISGSQFTVPIFFSSPTPFNCLAEVKFKLLRLQ